MTNRIQLRRDTATNWTNANPVLLAGEVGVDLTNKKIKLGDGTTRWNSLEYWDDQESGDFDGSYSSLTGKPSLFSGSYTDLTNAPSIPTNTNQLTNGAGFITLNDVDLSGLATENYVDTAIGNIPAVDLSGLATENYVDTAIGNIPAVDLSGLATENYVDTAVSSLVDSAPGTLDTLNELAAALGDDANFATTVTTALGTKAPINNPTFTGTVSGVTATMVGLGNVTNESKATMFSSPTFTGTVGGVTATMVGLGNVTNESKATMFSSPTFTGTVGGVTATHVGLGNVTNESKTIMFSSPTFTGTVSGVTATHVGLGNVTNESKDTMFTSPTFTGTVSGVTATHVGLGNVTNESKDTMFTSPTFTGTVSGVTATHVGLGNVTNESKATMFSSPTFTGLTTLQQSSEVIEPILGALDTVTHNFSLGSIWIHSGHSTFVPNFTNIPTTSYRAISVTLVLLQGASAFVPSTIQINSSVVTVNWLNGETPISVPFAKDIVSFTLIREIGDWVVIGSVASYKAV